MFIKKASLFTLSLLIAGAVSVSAGVRDERSKPGDDKKKKTEKKENDDTTRMVVAADVIAGNAEDENVEVNDSLLMFPSQDLYAIWDTTVIHPYSFAGSFKTDSALITFTEPTDCGFVMPFKGPVTSDFGWRRRRPHYGTDINLETGDTVLAAFDGMVRIAKLNRSYGNVVIIRHKNGLETVYAHLSKILVEPGQTIEAGQQIGLGGNTGHSYGSHLHFEMRYLGQALDAEDFIDFKTWSLKSNDFMLHKSDVENKYDLRATHARHKRDLSTARKGSKAGVTTTAKGKYYTIKQGDTLGRIAQRYHTSIKTICAKNGFKQNKVLRPGQKIKI